jgi:deoxyribodipyrimidine photo-lyase
MNTTFPPTIAAARVRLAAVDALSYAKTRNYLGGAVTCLSPYITHGFIPLPEIVANVEARFAREQAEKLISEFGWREFFMHAWRHAGEGILHDMRPPLAGVQYQQKIPDDVLLAQTGVRVIDESINTLYRSGYLHNHARMWLASYLVHLRKVHWRTGADWLYSYLLDGDLGSNHLSWQWVAGTFSTKPYLFNAENVARFAPSLVSSNSVIDTSYEVLAGIAQSSRDVGAEPFSTGRLATECTPPPALFANPMQLSLADLAIKFVTQISLDASVSVQLIHPWMLSEPQTNKSEQNERNDAKAQSLGIIHLPFHTQFPWSAKRWAFVLERMQQLAPVIFVGDVNALLAAHSGSLAYTTSTLNFGYAALNNHPQVTALAYPKFVPDPAQVCGSFTQFWRQSGRSTSR